MAIGRVNTGGGGAGGFASIGVTYPEGSICTCSNGIKTLKAKGTTGAFIFSVPSAGTWTITATNGTDIGSAEVVVSERYQVFTVDISYRLPSIYQEVAYLQSNGSQFLQLNLGANQNSGFAMDCVITNTSTYWTTSLGWYDASSNKYSLWNQNSSLMMYYGGQNHSFAFQKGNQLSFQLKNKVLHYNGSVIKTFTNEEFTTGGNIQLFKADVRNGTYAGASIQISRFKFYDGDTLIMDLVPCYRKADNVAGMWDSIGKVFYTNAGSGTFVVGGNI